LEYPKESGELWTFPEIDQAIMMNAKEAKKKLRAEQKPLIDRLHTYLTEQDIKTNH
jgi:predicted NUDIX family NTP pyrophosphohydrolase